MKRKRPSWWSLFIAAPIKTLATHLYSFQQRTAPLPEYQLGGIVVVCVSDTHNTQPAVPDGDLLIHAGDLTQSGSFNELQAAINWLDSLPHRYKVVIAGNHDLLLDKSVSSSKTRSVEWGSIIYLQDSSVALRFLGGRVLNIFGSPWTGKHGNWAFQYPKDKDVWTDAVPSDLDILVTHGPPRFHLDLDGFGDDFLLQEIWRTRPRLCISGHIHAGYGKELLEYNGLQRAYESIRRGDGGLLEFIKMTYQLVLSRNWPNTNRGTILVNASAVGGLRDTIKRAPIVVHL